MHEALRLCMKKWPGLEEGEQPKCTKTTQNARSSAPMHQKEPAHRKCTIDKSTPNARSTAPVHEKWSGVG